MGIAESLKFLEEVLTEAEAMKNESLVYECLKMTLQVHIQAEDVKQAREVLDRLMTLKQDDDELKSDSARINRMETALSLKKGAGTIETLQKDLQAAVTAQDAAAAQEVLG